MKKALKILIGLILFFVLVFIGLFVYYDSSLDSTGSSSETVEVLIPSGSSTKDIIDILYENDLIKNNYTAYFYVKIHDIPVLQAGKYTLNKGMDFKEILDYISSGNVIDESISVTFVEGKKLTTYVKQISETFGYSEEEILNKLEDKEYLNGLINKYWFLTEDILNDKLYYALEGYLYPDTYAFNKDDSIETIIGKMLDEMDSKLTPYKSEFENSSHSIHELLTMASIVELEGVNDNDRAKVAGVFYNRLAAGWSLGSDVTAYYGSKVDLSERDLYLEELEADNGYNTRIISMAGKLPIGPICNPGLSSIKASLEPEMTEYYFFVADKNGNTYFTKTNEEHQAKIAELKAAGLWYEY